MLTRVKRKHAVKRKGVTRTILTANFSKLQLHLLGALNDFYSGD